MPDLLKARQFGGFVVVIYNNGLLSESIGQQNEKSIVEYCGRISVSNIELYNPKYLRMFSGLETYSPSFIPDGVDEDSRVVVEFYDGGRKVLSYSLGVDGKTVYVDGKEIVDSLGFAQFALDQLPFDEIQRLREVGGFYGKLR